MSPAALWGPTRTTILVLVSFAFVTAALLLHASPALAFSDVSGQSPYRQAIEDIAERGIVAGYPDGTFRPLNPLFRAQFAKMICETMELVVTEDIGYGFRDLGLDSSASLYPHEYVGAAAEKKIILGYPDGTFRPYTNVARAQVITMVVRATRELRPGALLAPPSEYASKVGTFDPNHGPLLEWAEYNGLLEGLVGYGKGWDPWAPMNRGETAQVLHNLIRALHRVVSADVGGRHALAVTLDGSLWTWGDNYHGQLGTGLEYGDGAGGPVRIGAPGQWRAASAGAGHTVAIRADGTLWAWGDNSWRQLGIEGESYLRTPAQMGSDKDWRAVSAGSHHTLGIKADGSLWSWGNSFTDQLEQTGYALLEPHRVGPETDWAMISAGYHYSMALKTDGSLWAWGDNMDGQLGVPELSSGPTPVRVGTDNDWRMVSAGTTHTCAIREDGSLWAWGSNGYGKLGTGEPGKRTTPTRIGTDMDWRVASAEGQTTVAVKNDGTLWAWGLDLWGVLTGDLVQLVPARLGADSDWVSVAAGGRVSFGLKTDGSLWSWGTDEFGQLGTPGYDPIPLPARIGF